jgi:hypothetical protein
MKKASRTATADEPAPAARAVDELIAAQGVKPLAQFEDLFGAGRDLWTDEEFQTFLEQVRTTREDTE